MVPLLPTFCVESSNSRKCHLKKGFKYFDFLFTAYIFCIFSSVDFSHQSVDFSHQKVPSALLPQGVSAPQKVTKGINNPYIPFFFKKQVFSKRSKKSKIRIKPFFQIPCLVRSKPAHRVSSMLLEKNQVNVNI